MVEVDEEKIKRIKNQILMLSPKTKLHRLTSTFYSDTELRLDIIAKKIVNEEEPPVILWNVQPWNTFNLLHAVYCQKLKECIEIGFNCAVILYDKLIEKKKGIPSQEKASLQEAVKNCIVRFKKAGLKEEKTEFLTESDLWSFIKFEEFAETVTALAHLCDFDKNWTKREGVVSFIMDNLCEIYYESVINCDILLAGDVDVQSIWGLLRSKVLDRNLLPQYSPPLVLFYPTLMGIDSKPLSTSSDNNSLSIHHSNEEIRGRLVNCPEQFLETLFDYLIIPWKQKIEVNGGIFHSFEELKEKLSMDEIRNLAFNYMKDYFYKIRGTEL